MRKVISEKMRGHTSGKTEQQRKSSSGLKMLIMIGLLISIVPSALALSPVGKSIIYSGPPDLVIGANAVPDQLPFNSILTRYNFDPVQSSLVTLKVENRLTSRSFWIGPIYGYGYKYYGSDAKNVNVSVDLPNGLALAGNIWNSGDFKCNTSNRQNIVCSEGTIPAGSSVDIQIEVISTLEDSCSNFWLEIPARVDPYGLIPEVNETNNNASTAIFLSGPC